MSMFKYIKINFKLTSEQLGTCTSASVYAEHVLKSAQKQIKKANRLSGKVSKAFQKYKGTDPISEIKEVMELKGIIRSYQEVLGVKEDLPDDIDDLLEYSKKCEEQYDALVSEGREQRATIFMKDKDGWPMLSTHTFIGFFKENAKIIANNDTSSKDTKLFKSKVSVQEMLALDVKPIGPFVRPSKDILRDENGKPKICERIIRFERMGKTETSIGLSEQLPVYTEYEVLFRVRANSPFASNDFQLIKTLLECGKSNGLGQWRGSGGKGQFVWKLDEITEKDIPKDPELDGWN